eukprot:494738_1
MEPTEPVTETRSSSEEPSRSDVEDTGGNEIGRAAEHVSNVSHPANKTSMTFSHTVVARDPVVGSTEQRSLSQFDPTHSPTQETVSSTVEPSQSSQIDSRNTPQHPTEQFDTTTTDREPGGYIISSFESVPTSYSFEPSKSTASSFDSSQPARSTFEPSQPATSPFEQNQPATPSFKPD